MPEFSLVESIFSCLNNFSFTGHQQNHAYLYGYDIKMEYMVTICLLKLIYNYRIKES